MELMRHQKEALELLDNGRILYGGVGSGKSAVALAYYMKREAPKNVYIITTAKKRDSLEWLGDAAKFGIGREPEGTVAGILTIDSWNNIGRYCDTEDSFFIFDEQRVSGGGAWVKSFLKIVRRNRWILLSATPGDNWLDYAPVFIANGWYKNITDFKRQHVIYAPYVRFPKVLRYIGTDRLERLRTEVLVEMPYMRHTKEHMNYLDVGHDEEALRQMVRTRWNYRENQPFNDISALWRAMRRLINTHESRLETIRFLMQIHPRLIIFYNFDYELEILRELGCDPNLEVAEWNGHRHEHVPWSDRWVYLVQYQAGSEGWNCTSTDAMCFYSLTYSYKNFRQALGRNNRLNTPYTDLYYYMLKSDTVVDRALLRALSEKRDFNEARDVKTAAYEEVWYK